MSKTLTLDKHGYQLIQKELVEKTFEDEYRIKKLYYPEVAELIKRVTEATKIYVGQHVIRRRSWDAAFEEEKNLRDDARSTGPSDARFVHYDLALDGARARIAKLRPENADKLYKCRWATVNLWKPFDYPVRRDALCLADSSSTRNDALRPIKIRFPARRDSVREEAA
ncbi:hypothetical protein CBER1_08355 [Cercospora berteroae]|uniref:Uncharacterized protein n=1 Tax=Cercospora berteroae TaxID=357750 RepID=A0A2S6CFG6_9PEZI|nr:hypothetical protein CBER1_08355 [Cercospora berteroae]